MTDPDPLASRQVVEWDWVVNAACRVLHAPVVWDDPHYDAYTEHGQTACGYRGWISIPGLFARMGVMRCKACCRITGMPQGKGSPKNDDECRVVVKERLGSLGLV